NRIPGPRRARHRAAAIRCGRPLVRDRAASGARSRRSRQNRGHMTDLSSLYDDPVFRSGEPEAAPRLAALQAAYAVDVEATSLVAYRSTGYALIVGAERDALECADVLREHLHCTVLPTAAATGALSESAAAARADETRVMIVRGEPGEISGHLG